MTELVFDLEADGYLMQAKHIWCWSALDLQSGVQRSGRDALDLMSLMEQYDTVIGHNIEGYDIPLMARLLHMEPGASRFDTIVAARLLWPDLPSPAGWKGKPQPHSIEAWAMRFGGEQKVGIDDWSTYTPEMLERCESDVRITARLYAKIRREISG